jgi:hypothetical protein
MGQTQYYGLAKTPNYGLDYESMIKALARGLPEAYANKQIAASRDASNTAALDYYNKMTEIGNRENELTADQIALNKDSMEAAQDAQLQQTGLGLLGTGISAYGLYKNASLAKQIANAGKDIGGEVINAEPGILSKTWDGAKGLASSAYDKLFGPTIDPSTAINLGLESTSNVIPGTVDMAAGWEAIPAMESGAALNIAENAAPAVVENTTLPVLENAPYIAEYAADAGASSLFSEGIGSGLGQIGSTIISKALPWYAVAKAGGTIINAITDNNPWMKDTPFGVLGESLDEPMAVEDYFAKKLSDKVGGDEETYEYFLQTANPLEVGSWVTDTREKLLNTATGGLYTPVKELYDEVKDHCIIVTTCTDRYSPEVNITREYRNKFMTAEQIRGYYIIADKVVPVLKRYNLIKKLTKTLLVDNLINYGKFALGKTKKANYIATIISKAFLRLCQHKGSLVEQYVRLNGEIY